MTPADRVRRLIVEGRVSPDEGARLLAAMSEAPHPSPLRILFDPFDRWSGGVAAIFGLVISAASLGMSRLGIRFDGFLDMHVGRAAIPPLATALLDQGVGWILPSFCFWLYARLLSRHVRLLDFVGAVGLGRLPVLLASLPAYFTFRRVGDPIHPSPIMIAIAIVALVFVVWNIALLYTGFRNASGLTGAKLVGGFVGLTLVIEGLSKLVIHLV